MSAHRVTLGVVVTCRDDDELEGVIEAFADKGIYIDSAERLEGDEWVLRIPDFIPAALSSS